MLLKSSDTRRILIALFLGVLLSLASAWIPARFLNSSSNFSLPMQIWDERSRTLGEHIRTRFAAEVTILWSYRALFRDPRDGELSQEAFLPQIENAGLFPSWAQPDDLDLSGVDPDTIVEVRRQAFGFPFLALSRTMITLENRDEVVRSAFLSRHGDYFAFDHALPTKIHWPGFLLNSFLYASIFALPWLTVTTVRRRRRLARNACPECGYSRAGLVPGAPCPECGRSPRPPKRD